MSFFLVSLLAFCQVWQVLATITTSTVPICSQQPYKAILPLSKYAPAQSFCSSKYPLPTCSITVTATAVSTVTNTVSITPSTRTVVASTLLTTSTTGTTTLETTAATTTASVIVTSVTTIVFGTSTATITVPTTSTVVLVAKRGESEVTAAAVVARADTSASALFSLAAQAKSIISTACSCIEKPVPCVTVTATTTRQTIITRTATFTATASVVSTSVNNVQAIATSFITQIISTTVTRIATADIATTTTLSVTAVSTVTACANPTQTFTLQVNSGERKGMYIHEDEHANLLADPNVTPQGFYLDNNGALTDTAGRILVDYTGGNGGDEFVTLFTAEQVATYNLVAATCSIRSDQSLSCVAGQLTIFAFISNFLVFSPTSDRGEIGLTVVPLCSLPGV
ncbi:hypothetical protein B0A48_06016 [Cryoendolithus antarcticus]|uniref:Uncharacterized protein n=1 Tax=Cryoendolithus antarcticus TaxID=1507870 RepID=A0A1V8TCN3_9PEZI|nr:hypothetical protein B0A48_06016 [Cryoendolithus antarcticus]